MAGRKILNVGALAEPAGDLDPALVLLDDAIDRRQPEAGALADFLGGEERLEDPRQMFRRNARAGVAHRQTNKLPGRASRLVCA